MRRSVFPLYILLGVYSRSRHCRANSRLRRGTAGAPQAPAGRGGRGGGRCDRPRCSPTAA